MLWDYGNNPLQLWCIHIPLQCLYSHAIIVDSYPVSILVNLYRSFIKLCLYPISFVTGSCQHLIVVDLYPHFNVVDLYSHFNVVDLYSHFTVVDLYSHLSLGGLYLSSIVVGVYPLFTVPAWILVSCSSLWSRQDHFSFTAHRYLLNHPGVCRICS